MVVWLSTECRRRRTSSWLRHKISCRLERGLFLFLSYWEFNQAYVLLEYSFINNIFFRREKMDRIRMNRMFTFSIKFPDLWFLREGWYLFYQLFSTVIIIFNNIKCLYLYFWINSPYKFVRVKYFSCKTKYIDERSRYFYRISSSFQYLSCNKTTLRWSSFSLEISNVTES